MRRLLSILLVVAMLLSLCACSNVSEVEEALIGTYVASDENFAKAIRFYEDGTFHEVYENALGMEYDRMGIWEIEKDTIVLYNGDTINHYAYEYDKTSGTLELFLYVDDNYITDTPLVKYDE